MINSRNQKINLLTGLKKLANAIGPGVFIIGYVIGTGSVTTMTASGAKYGLSMTWAIALSCFFTYILIVSISRLTIASENTLIHNIKLKFGKLLAILMLCGLMLTVIASVIGITAIATDIFSEWTRILNPAGNRIHPALAAVIMIGILYYLFWFGKHRFFLRVMSVIVAFMGVCFLTSMFMVIPDTEDVISGLIPAIPVGDDAHLVLAGLVGTTMAAIVLVSRTYLVAEQGWTFRDLKAENRDAVISLVLTFILSMAIMAAAAGTMFPRGISVERAMDMVISLEPIAGRFASSIFVLGIIAAAFSSLFPSYLMGPWMAFDYLNKPRKMDRKRVRAGVLIVASLGFIVPVFKGNPVVIMIASQAVSPVIMPLLILFVFILLRSKRIVGDYKNPRLLDIGLGLTFLFSLFMSYTALVAFFKLI